MPEHDTHFSGRDVADAATLRVLLCGERPLIVAGLAALLGTSPRAMTVRTMSLTEGGRYPDLVSSFDVAVLDSPEAELVSTIVSGRDARRGEPWLIVFSSDQDLRLLTSFLHSGVLGLLLADSTREDFLAAVEAAAAGQAWLPPAVASDLLTGMRHADPLPTPVNAPPEPALTAIGRLQPEELTEREREIIDMIIRGRSNAEIASELFVTLKTVKFHVSNILRKTGAPSRMELIIRTLS